MTDETHAVIVIGGGPAGLAAACKAAEAGCDDVVILERNSGPGGILNQCIHDGFGLELFKESLTGPEWAARYVRKALELGVRTIADTMVLELRPDRTLLVSGPDGLRELRAGAVVLAMGCRERTRDALVIPGTRPAGIYTAGLAQSLINMKGYMVGTKAVVLGSGDIGLIMARRLTLEGAEVSACVEILPYPSGLPRNVVQCLEDYDIPLLLSHTVTGIHGRERVEGVTVSRVGDDMEPVPGTERLYECDTLLLSVGLIPENELSAGAGVAIDPVTGGAAVDQSLHTSVTGVFACGNALHVHDLVDDAAVEAARAGEAAWCHARDGLCAPEERWTVPVSAGEGIGYAVPQLLGPGSAGMKLGLRVTEPGRDICLTAVQDGSELGRRKVPRADPSVMLHLKLKVGARNGGPVTVMLSGGGEG